MFHINTYTFILYLFYIFTDIVEAAIDRLMFDRELNSVLLDGMHQRHKSVLFNYWSLNKNTFIHLQDNCWPPSMEIILGIFRRREYWKDYQNDLPSKHKWMRLEGDKFQPAPQSTDKDECPLGRIVSLLENSNNTGQQCAENTSPPSSVLRFRRNGSKNKHTFLVNVFVDSNPLKQTDFLEDAMRIALSKNKKIFMKKKDHEMVLEMMDTKDKPVMIFFKSDFKTVLKTVIETAENTKIIVFEVKQREVVDDSEEEDYEDIHI